MSCIYGVINFDNKPVEGEELGLMTATLNYWNADKVDTTIVDCVGLGQLTLWNTPESKYEKALSQQERDIKIVANARIDNREELFVKIDVNGNEARLISDTGLILLAYKKYGADCVKHLVGDFAFAIWDGAAQRLFCARDHMGIKPFFYYLDNGRFIFASEIKGILCLKNIDRRLNDLHFYQQLLAPLIDSHDETLYQKINRLKPAHYIAVQASAKGATPRRYWNMDTDVELNFANRQDYYDGLLHHFEHAIKCRVRSAYPVGAELSGGLDSSAITVAANAFLQHNGKQVISFSNVFSQAEGEVDQKRDERRYIRDVIGLADIKNPVFLTEKAFANYLDEVDFTLWANDGPNFYNIGWQLPTRKAAAAMGVRTMLSGFPGDQMVTSANKSYFLDFFHNRQYLRYFRAQQNPQLHFNKARPFFPSAVLNAARQLKHHLGFYGQPVKNALSIYNIPSESQKKLDSLLLQRRENFFLKSYREGQKSILLRPVVYNRLETDTRFGYYFKLEPRFPMADIRLTQYYLSMPNYIKYEDAIPRNAYRLAVKKHLPQSVFNRDDKFGSIAPFVTPHEYLNDLNGLLKKLPSKSKFINMHNAKNNVRQLTALQDPYTLFAALLTHPYPTIEVLKWLEKNADDPALAFLR